MFTVKSLHVAFEIWGCIFCLIAALCIYYSKGLEAKRRKYLMYLQLTTACLLLNDALAWGFRGNPGTIGYYMVHISNFMVFAASDVILIWFHAYLCTYIFSENQKEEKKLVRVNLGYAIAGIGIALVVISQFTDLYYYFDADNFYHRSTLYPVSLGVGILCMVIDLSLLLQYRKQIKLEIFLSLISYIVFPGIAAFILLFYYGASLINIAMNISMILMFVVAMVEQSKVLTSKEKELYDLKIEVMLSKIKPHFIYNTLAAIKHLCKKDPQLAAETVDEFSRYLRGNLDSLTLKECIPFERELEHAQNYLAIERKRFGDRVRVEYEIEEEDFLIPALTLQPIVENAVKHGITKRSQGGMIRISTYREKDAFVILVEDNGVGFDVHAEKKEDGRSHIGITNVKDRLETMRGGTLTVSSVPGEGTKVCIRLPIKSVWEKE